MAGTTRVLLVLSGCPSETGGVEVVASHILNSTKTREDVEMGVICTGPPQTDTWTHYRISAIGRGPLRTITFGHSFRKKINEIGEEWDVFHFHLRQARDPLLFAPADIVERSIVTLHTTEAGVKQNIYDVLPHAEMRFGERIQKLGYSRLAALLEEHSLGRAPLLTATTGAIRDEAEQHYGVNVGTIINNGVDPNEIPARDWSEPSETPTILFVGRLTPQKGVFRAIDAVSAVDSDFEWKIVGDGPYRDRVEEYCHRSEIDPTLLGNLTHESLRRLYAESDVLLMTSYYEGLPMTGLEAAAAGLPIVAFDSTNLRDVVTEANRPFIYRDGETAALTKGLTTLLEDTERAEEIGRANRKRIQDSYTASQMAKEYRQMYREFAQTVRP